MAYQRLGSMGISWTVYNNDNLYIVTKKPQKSGAFEQLCNDSRA